MKISLFSQIRDFQRLLEEKDRQKDELTRSKDDDISKLKTKLTSLEENVKELIEKETNLKAKIQKVVMERGGEKFGYVPSD